MLTRRAFLATTAVAAAAPQSGPKRIAIVALARKLIVALWRYLTSGLVPEGAVIA